MVELRLHVPYSQREPSKGYWGHMSPHITTINTKSGLQFGISIRVQIGENGQEATVTILPLQAPEQLNYISKWEIHYSQRFIQTHRLNHTLLLDDAHSQIGIFMEGFADRWAESPRGTFVLMRG